jgi:cell division septum initiation protein DivIVA
MNKDEFLDFLEKQLIELCDYINHLEKECAAMREQLNYLETQIYGGSTK